MLNTARIAKNTVFLYLRMILVLAANFLAVRVLLEVLGVALVGLVFSAPFSASKFSKIHIMISPSSTLKMLQVPHRY